MEISRVEFILLFKADIEENKLLHDVTQTVTFRQSMFCLSVNLNIVAKEISTRLVHYEF